MGEPNGSIVTVVNNVVNLLKSQNGSSTMYNISEGLQRDVVAIEAGKPIQGQALTQFPAVLVTASEYSDRWGSLGGGNAGGRRDVDYKIDVYAATNTGLGQSYSSVVEENLRLTDNLLTLFRTKYDLSMSGFWIDEINVTMDEEIADSVMQKTAHIVLSAHEIV